MAVFWGGVASVGDFHFSDGIGSCDVASKAVGYISHCATQIEFDTWRYIVTAVFVANYHHVDAANPVVGVAD